SQRAASTTSSTAASTNSSADKLTPSPLPASRGTARTNHPRTTHRCPGPGVLTAPPQDRERQRENKEEPCPTRPPSTSRGTRAAARTTRPSATASRLVPSG